MVGRELEKLGYRWLEEPLLDVNFNGLRKLREKLDIPICGTEVLARRPLLDCPLHPRGACGHCPGPTCRGAAESLR